MSHAIRSRATTAASLQNVQNGKHPENGVFNKWGSLMRLEYILKIADSPDDVNEFFFLLQSCGQAA